MCSASYLREREQVVKDAKCVLVRQRYAQYRWECPYSPHLWQNALRFAERLGGLRRGADCGVLVILVGARCHFREAKLYLARLLEDTRFRTTEEHAQHAVLLY